MSKVGVKDLGPGSKSGFRVTVKIIYIIPSNMGSIASRATNWLRKYVCYKLYAQRDLPDKEEFFEEIFQKKFHRLKNCRIR